MDKLGIYIAALQDALEEKRAALPVFLIDALDNVKMFEAPLIFQDAIKTCRELCYAQPGPIQRAFFGIRFVISIEARNLVGFKNAIFVFNVTEEEVHIGMQGYSDTGETADAVLWDSADVLNAAKNLTQQMQLWIAQEYTRDESNDQLV